MSFKFSGFLINQWKLCYFTALECRVSQIQYTLGLLCYKSLLGLIHHIFLVGGGTSFRSNYHM